jgi:hypothetical protein
VTWHPERIGETVRRELERFGPAGGIAEVVAAWPQAVGPAIAKNAWPARIGRDGTLTVTAGSSVWAFELTKLEDTIRARLGEALAGDVPPKIRFVPGRLPEPGAESEPTPPQAVAEPGPLARQAGAEVAAGIENEELRAIVERAAAASLARRLDRPDDRAVW